MFQNWENVEEYRIDQARVGPGEQGEPVKEPKDPGVAAEVVSAYYLFNPFMCDCHFIVLAGAV